VPPDLQHEIEMWIAGHPNRNEPRAFMFPSSSGTAFSVGNYLKRYLKPLAEKAGVHDVTHQAFRRTSSTHIQNYASVKDMQRHLRHTDPQTTLKHYAKVIPESLRAAVAALDAKITGCCWRINRLGPSAINAVDAGAIFSIYCSVPIWTSVLFACPGPRL